MVSLIALHAIIFLAAAASATGAFCVLKGLHIFDLKIRTRNCMYVGACCAMCFGFLGATACLGSLVTTQWHYLAALLLCTTGVFATVHIAVDLSDRLRILKRGQAL